MDGAGQPNLRITIIAADGLYKRDVFRFPDPFAVATINGEQTRTTSVIKKTLNPYWNESFDMRVNEESVLAVQIFDQKKFKKKDQGFLGVINVRIGSVIDLDAGGDEMLTRDLKKSNDNMVVHGKLILNLSTNLATPISQGTANGARPTASPHPSVSGPAVNGASTPQQSTQNLHPDAFPGQARPPVAAQPPAHRLSATSVPSTAAPQCRRPMELRRRTGQTAAHTVPLRTTEGGYRTAGKGARTIWAVPTTSTTTPGRQPGYGQAQDSARRTRRMPWPRRPSRNAPGIRIVCCRKTALELTHPPSLTVSHHPQRLGLPVQ
ncbi:hypothetical protein JI435_417560 [Parastagonospora nodorum SN15]|uniref:C2 domain-containing protein n=1 Tax=Phaeosphaeria nodorum (strain SN15 / ATCC MYA-4574 / FGSC 10173) TaxID=321614 RepID=A0A7U2I529_PHANO|nr:hypothetical protein JI435_417560 [Parastagonospora nodorum SN15]